MKPRKMPIGLQDFRKIREGGYVYVDKTALVFQLVSEGNPYFLGRPRRFGKSLLLSTLKAYFLGQRELFESIPSEGTTTDQPRLAIADLEKDWIEHPVFHIDLNVGNYTDLAALEAGLDANLRPLEEKWGRDPQDITPSVRLLNLIRRASEKTGKKVVALVDEYDKPLLRTLEDDHEKQDIQGELRSFYSVLKTADPWLRFVLLTGVTKFSKISVFSDLNQLRDISMSAQYTGICGISAAELADNFDPELHLLAEENGLSYEETLEKMHRFYDGYHFCENTEGIFNPFGVLNTLADRKFKYYWFETGTPTFLIHQIKHTNFDIQEFSKGVAISPEDLTKYRADGGSLVPILYQSGYLTIKGYDPQFSEYTLGFPNEEVKYGFLENLMSYYIPQPPDRQGFLVSNFIKDLQKKDVDAFMTRIKAFIANVPYGLKDKTEKYFQNIFYLLFTLMGQYTQVEVHSALGRSDAVVITIDSVFLFEFKLAQNESEHKVDAALSQIDDKGYLDPYKASGKNLIKIGAQYNASTRNMGDWKVVTVLARL